MTTRGALKSAGCIALLISTFAIVGYGDVRRVQFKLVGTHGPYQAYLFTSGSGSPIREIHDIYPYGTKWCTFTYTSTRVRYYIRVDSNGYGSRYIGDFTLPGNWPGWYDSEYYAGQVSFP